MIEIDEVTKYYGDRRVVDRLSLTVPAGDFCVLLGSSGCGKSTTLKMINRLIAADAGQIRVGGEDIATVSTEQLRRRIGYAIQSIGLFPHWTVEDNIATVPRLLGWPRSRLRDSLQGIHGAWVGVRRRCGVNNTGPKFVPTRLANGTFLMHD